MSERRPCRGTPTASVHLALSPLPLPTLAPLPLSCPTSPLDSSHLYSTTWGPCCGPPTASSHQASSLFPLPTLPPSLSSPSYPLSSLQQNLGAMLRSAHCLGASGVIASAKNCAPLSAVVSKASAGALEVMTLYNCRNLPRTLADAAERGWAVVGAAGEAGATPLTEFVADKPTVLVMGERAGCIAV